MYTLNRTLSALFVLTLGASNLSAALIDTLTLTPAGSNTDFVITGTFAPDAPITPSSAPNTPYQLSFSLPTVPSTFLVLDSENVTFVLGTVGTLNGVNYPDTSVAFFPGELGGGVQVCLGIVCNPEGTVGFATFDIFAQQLYTGDFTTPVFISGAQDVDPSQSAIVFATPEPASIALSGLGIGLLIVSSIRRRSKCTTSSLGPADGVVSSTLAAQG